MGNGGDDGDRGSAQGVTGSYIAQARDNSTATVHVHHHTGPAPDPSAELIAAAEALLAPWSVEERAAHAPLALVARPAPAAGGKRLLSGLLDDADPRIALRDAVRAALAAYPPAVHYDLHPDDVWRRSGSGWKRATGVRREDVVEMMVRRDGSAHLLCGRTGCRGGTIAGFSVARTGDLVLFGPVIACVVSRALAVLGQLLARAGYDGPVQAAVAVRGVTGRVWADAVDGYIIRHVVERDAEYDAVEEVDAPLLARDPAGVARWLVRDLLDELTQGGENPFTAARPLPTLQTPAGEVSIDRRPATPPSTDRAGGPGGEGGEADAESQGRPREFLEEMESRRRAALERRAAEVAAHRARDAALGEHMARLMAPAVLAVDIDQCIDDDALEESLRRVTEDGGLFPWWDLISDEQWGDARTGATYRRAILRFQMAQDQEPRDDEVYFRREQSGAAPCVWCRLA